MDEQRLIFSISVVVGVFSLAKRMPLSLRAARLVFFRHNRKHQPSGQNLIRGQSSSCSNSTAAVPKLGGFKQKGRDTCSGAKRKTVASFERGCRRLSNSQQAAGTQSSSWVCAKMRYANVVRGRCTQSDQKAYYSRDSAHKFHLSRW